MPKDRIMIAPDTPICESMRAIDEGALGIVLVVDGIRRLLGTVTDGDIRRAILRGVNLDQPAGQIMHRDPVTVCPSVDMQEIRRIFIESGLKHLPVVDAAGRVLDLVTISQLLSVP